MPTTQELTNLQAEVNKRQQAGTLTPEQVGIANKQIAANVSTLPQDQQAIIASNLSTQKPVNLPTYPTDTTDYQGLTDSGNAIIGAGTKKEPEKSSADLLFEKYLSGATSPTSTAEQYASAYNDTGVAGIGQEVASRQNIATQAQKELDLLNAQLQGITAKATKQNLQLEGATGQLGDVTASYLNKQQQEVNRQAAIEALPLQAQILTAQAKVSAAQGDVTTAQNNLKLAQDRLATVFNLKTKDAENTYNYNKDLRDKVYEYATAKEKAKIDAQQKEDDRNFELYKIAVTTQKELSNKALESGQADIAAEITKLNPSSATYEQDLYNLQRQIKTTQQEYKNIKEVDGGLFDLSTNTWIVEPTTKDNWIETKDGRMFNKNTGKYMDETAGLSSQAQAVIADNETKISEINSLLEEDKPFGAMRGAVGSNPLGRFNISNIFTGKQQEFVAGVEQLVQGMTLQNLIDAKAKGATFGALSEGELKVLAQSASKIGTWKKIGALGDIYYDVSEEAFTKELNKIKDYLTKDSALKLGKSTGYTEKEIRSLFEKQKPSEVLDFLKSGNISGGSGTPTASEIVDAIKKTESRGNYSAKGESGETGAYQFMPETWKKYAREYAIATGQSVSKQTPENQDKVAQFKVQQWLDKGYDAKQIASMWNAGEGRPDAWKNWKGVNSLGVSYDTPAYVKKVLSNLG